MASEYREVLFDCDTAPFVFKGLRSRSIKEPAVGVTIGQNQLGNFQALEIFEQVAGFQSFPQTIADIISNSYFRLSYHKPDGTSATFGTSVIGAMSFRTSDRKLNLIPLISRVEIILGDPHRLKVCLAGRYGDYAQFSSERTYATRACVGKTTMIADISLTALKDICLEQSMLRKDAFRLFSLSSMYSTELCYDSNLVRYRSGGLTRSLRLCGSTARGAYLINSGENAAGFELVKETGSAGLVHKPGSPDAPSVRAQVLESSMPLDQLAIQAYLDESTGINDDSLSSWIEWAGCPAVIKEGQQVSVKIEVEASPPENPAHSAVR